MNNETPYAHFSFSNSLYDECSLKKKQQESEFAGSWMMDASVVQSNDVCHQQQSPFMHSPYKNAVPLKFVDAESDLRNQTRKLSRCPEERFPKNATNGVADLSSMDVPFENCKSGFLSTEYTRIDKPCNVFSGITINRFHPLIEDLQSPNKIHHNGYIGMNTRLAIKDGFAKKQ